MKVKEYSLFWRNGNSQVITGRNITNALINVGITNKTLKKLDFWSDGDLTKDYTFNQSNKTWLKN